MSYTAIVCAQILYNSDLPSLHEVYSQLQCSTLLIWSPVLVSILHLLPCVTVRAAHKGGKIMEVAIEAMVDKIQEVMDTLETKNLINKCTVTATIIQ